MLILANILAFVIFAGFFVLLTIVLYTRTEKKNLEKKNKILLHEKKVQRRNYARSLKSILEEIEIDDEVENRKKIPFEIGEEGEIYRKIEKYAFEINDGHGELSALRHLEFIQSRLYLNETDTWEQVKNLWDIKRMDNRQFNEFCKWIYEQQGWKLEITDGYNDGGIDIRGEKIEQGHRKHIIIQCKNWKNWSIGENVVSQFAGKPKVDQAKKMGAELIFITSSFFSKRGKDTAEQHHITMLNFYDLLKEYKKYEIALQLRH